MPRAQTPGHDHVHRDRALAAGPQAVLDVLTDPVAAARWSPVGFRLAEDTPRLRPGARVRIVGEFAGRPVGFDVDVHEAEAGRLALTADGPVGIRRALRRARRRTRGSRIAASVAIRPRSGLLGRVIASATRSMLAAGALDRTVRRIASEAACA